MDTLSFKRGKKKNWVKSKEPIGGICFTMSFDKLEEKLHASGVLSIGETVDCFTFSDYGITVYVGGNIVIRSSVNPRV